MIGAKSRNIEDHPAVSGHNRLRMQTREQVSQPNFGNAAERLFELQVEQFKHDETYHREIARLTVKERLTHMALHFAKYVGYLSDGSENEIDRVVVDTFIIALSSANTLNFKVADRLEVDARRCGSLTELSNALESAARFNSKGELDSTLLLKMLAGPVGHMAKACEALDHIEAFPFREEISTAIMEILSFALIAANYRGIDIATEARARLSKVKEKSIFHNEL